MDGKISGSKSDENHDGHTVWKYFPIRVLLNIKEKITTLCKKTCETQLNQLI